MTTAVCLRCGAKKFGALTPCGECGFQPEEDEDQAKAVILSDHHFDRATLEQIGATIRAGETIRFEEEQVAQFVEALHEAREGSSRSRRGCVIALVVLVVLAVVLFALLR